MEQTVSRLRVLSESAPWFMYSGGREPYWKTRVSFSIDSFEIPEALIKAMSRAVT